MPLARALSDVQETAQLLTGDALPKNVLKALLTNNTEVGELVGVLCLSPYDGNLEKIVLRYHMENPGRRMRSLTLSTDLELTSYSEKILAMHLMEDIVLSIFDTALGLQ